MGRVIRAKRKTLEKTLKEFTKRKKANKLLDSEGKIGFSFTLEELIARRKKDVPHR
ncbi:MAG: hypothetical protein KGZ49_11645 [Syntrophaceae bacterium]|nr:hypothetical protein [Syntrophaceae bacterium]